MCSLRSDRWSIWSGRWGLFAISRFLSAVTGGGRTGGPAAAAAAAARPLDYDLPSAS